jgi:predicted amino acid dehydrogenase
VQPLRTIQPGPPEPHPPPQAGEDGIHRFAFVVHPLSIRFIHRHPQFRWTRWLPDKLVETVAAWLPPAPIGRITGGRSPATGQRIEGWLYGLGATPRQIMSRDARFTYSRLLQAARDAQRHGARILGLGAFTKVVGDAGATVAREAPIAVTSGNSLTIAATLEAAKQGAIRMGVQDLRHGRAMVIGATGAIGSVCARLLAKAIYDVVLVSIEPERLEALERTIRAETPAARVVTAMQADERIGDCDLVVTATSAFNQRVLDISRCKPGAVICDVALPPDVPAAEVALRPDVLAIEGGEVLIPGEVAFSYDVGLPPGVAYACLAEAALLAMEGRFESYTVGRDIDVDRVKEIYRLFRKHGFQIAGLRSAGRWLTDEDLAAKRALAESLRHDPERLARVQAAAAAKLAQLPPRSKGVAPQRGDTLRQWTGPAVVGAGIGLWIAWRRRRTRS